ncbi:HEAT repeat domain-containing protein, partial [Candidatus Woesearchaeota archaeon]|nr:HEAT repeat domain-containing protein [Candidatus Woesearchaeota archaeon]
YSMADARRGVYKPAVTPTVLGGEPEAVPQYAQSAIMRKEELTVRKAENLPAQVDKFLNGLPDRLMTDEFISLIDKLVEIKADANIKKLTAKFMENFRSSQPKIRTQANTFYTQLLNKAKVPARPVIMNEALTVLVEGIRTEQDGKIYTLLIESLLRNALFYLETSNYEELLKPISAINNRLEGKMLTTTEMTQKSEFFFHELKQSPAFQSVLANLKSKDLHLHNLSRQILNGLGILAVPELLTFIKETEETSFREEMLGFINSHGRAAQEFFLRELTKSDENGEIRPLQRLIEIAPLVPLHEVETSLMGFLKHRNTAVRDSALRAVRRFSKDSALKILLPLIDGKDKGLAVAAVETVADLGYKEATAEIVNLLETSRDDSIRKKCCLALGKLKDENTVPVLTGLLFKKKFLGLFGGVADEVRSSAVWALGQFRTPESIESLKLALNDKSPLVRSAAKIGLKEDK